MRYFSTRGHADPIAAKEAILKGLADDGGLFVPEQMPEKIDISRLSDLSYGDLAQMILSRFFDDYAAGELSSCINGAYSATNFDTLAIAPSIALDEAASVLELCLPGGFRTRGVRNFLRMGGPSAADPPV